MRYMEAPGSLTNVERPLVFLAGGITDCEDWQQSVAKEVCKEFKKGTLLNPRRADFPMDDPSAAEEQINWGHEALWLSDVISFWFVGGKSVQPIAMFEFGCHLGRFCIGGGPHRLVVGVDPDYKRKRLMELQLAAHTRVLTGPFRVVPVYSLKDHIRNIIRALKGL